MNVVIRTLGALAITLAPLSFVYAESTPRNQVLKFTDTGISPTTLRMEQTDSIVFFLNSTSESLVTFELKYGSRKTHCASSALTIGEDGVVRSAFPIGPRDFATVCFPEKGTYPITVYGLKGSPKGTSATIVVE